MSRAPAGTATLPHHPCLGCTPAAGIYLERSQVGISGVAAGDLSQVRWLPCACACTCLLRGPAGGTGQREEGGGWACLHARSWAAPAGAARRRPCHKRALHRPRISYTSAPVRVCALLAPQGALRFFHGHCAWGPGELERQVAQGAWQPAACRCARLGTLQAPCRGARLLPCWQQLCSCSSRLASRAYCTLHRLLTAVPTCN